MRTSKQILIAVAAAVVVAGAVGLRLARGPAVPGPDRATIRYDDPAGAAEFAAIDARVEAKAAAVRELMAGRRTLLETAAAFRDLDAQGPPPEAPIRDWFPNCSSDDEAYCRSVMAYVLNAHPCDQPVEWVRRLNDEVEARRRDGTLRLPQRPSSGHWTSP